MVRAHWPLIATGAAGIMLTVLVGLVLAVPRDNGEMLWTAQIIKDGWMAWSFPVALFFWVIASLLVLFTLLAIRFPETPRVGVLGNETTRGDRLFITLLGSAFINLAWLGLLGAPQWGALIVCLVYAAAVFRWV